VAPKNDKLQERLQKLQQEYTRKLPARIDGMEEAWRGVLEEGEPLALASLLHDAHGLNGSGAVYGYQNISAIARELEQLLLQLRDSSGEPDARLYERIGELIQALRNAVRLQDQPATPR